MCEPAWAQRALTRIAVTALLLAVLAPVVAAHGGGVAQLFEEPVGPYQVFAWTNPDPVRVGTMHLTVSLVEPDTQTPVLDAEVQVRATPLGTDISGAPLLVRATHEAADIKTYYEAEIELAEAGLWQVDVTIDTPEGAGSVGFELDVEPPSLTNWLLIGAAGLLLVTIAWLLLPAIRRRSEVPS